MANAEDGLNCFCTITTLCQRCKYTTSVDIQKACYKKLVIHVESHASAVSLLESGEQRYKKAINNNNNLDSVSLSGQMTARAIDAINVIRQSRRRKF